MSQLTIATVQDVAAMKYAYEVHDAVTVRTRRLKRRHVLRYAFKYALWALREGGRLIIEDEPPRKESHFRNVVTFWAVKSELAKCLGAAVEVVRVQDDLGRIEARKVRPNARYSGISFGLVFSGQSAEEPLLLEVLKSIDACDRLRDVPHEVLVSCPSNCAIAALADQFPALNVRHVQFDDAYDPAKRLLIAKKKADLFSRRSYDVLAISHLRIRYAADFVARTLARQFDAMTPQVRLAEKAGGPADYLDFLLVASYDPTRKGERRVLGSAWFGGNYLAHMARRVPYIDGALTVFNTQAVSSSPYDPSLAWGEAEDLDMCATLHQRGLVIDYFDDIICESLTSKVPQGGLAQRLRAAARSFYR